MDRVRLSERQGASGDGGRKSLSGNDKVVYVFSSLITPIFYTFGDPYQFAKRLFTLVKKRRATADIPEECNQLRLYTRLMSLTLLTVNISKTL